MSGDYVMISSIPPGAQSTAVQFCYRVPYAVSFPPGDTVLAVRLQDEAGNTGEIEQIVVRVPGS